MLSRLSPERERTLVRTAQIFRTQLVIGLVIIGLIVVYPNHPGLSGLLNLLYTGFHAAFPTLIK